MQDLSAIPTIIFFSGDWPATGNAGKIVAFACRIIHKYKISFPACVHQDARAIRMVSPFGIKYVTVLDVLKIKITCTLTTVLAKYQVLFR